MVQGPFGEMGDALAKATHNRHQLGPSGGSVAGGGAEAGGIERAVDDKPLVGHNLDIVAMRRRTAAAALRSEEHTSELQSLMRISYAVFCLKKKKNNTERIG